MTYLSWAMFVEGKTDSDYLSVLLPRLIEHIVLSINGPRAVIPEFPVEIFGITERQYDKAASAICAAREAFHLLFIHTDTGGRGLQGTIEDRTISFRDILSAKCNIDITRCIFVIPRKETEAWCLSDPNSLRLSLGLSNQYDLSGFSQALDDVERISDPKLLIQQIIDSALPRRRAGSKRIPYVALAQTQDILKLSQISSFAQLVSDLRDALASLGFRADQG
jgi:hypothetical protein